MIFNGLLDEAIQRGFALLSMYPAENIRDVERLPVFSRGDVDGMVALLPPYLFYPLLHKVRQNQKFEEHPVLSLMWQMPGCSVVRTDDADGAYAAASHLLELGHRHVMHFINNAGGELQDNRLAAVRRAFAERGLDPARHLHFEPLPDIPGAWLDPARLKTGYIGWEASEETEQQAREKFITSIKQRPDITAILAKNDANALHAWFALKQAGYQVPGDISIIGFDDTDSMLDDAGRNLLTSVRLPLHEVGCRAAQLMIRRILGEEKEDTTVVLPTSLIVRCSTAPPKPRV